MTVNYADVLSFCSTEKTDIPVIFSFSKNLIDTYEDVSSIPYEKVLTWVRNKIEQNIASYTRVCLNGETVGYFRVVHEDNQTELDDFYILEKYRGSGIGTAVLQHCIANAKTPLYLYVFSKNVGAIRLYKRMGFSISEEVGKTRFIMRREVDIKIP